MQPCLDAFKGDLEEFKDTILIQAVQEHSTVLSIQGDASHTYVVCHSVDENELVEEEGGLAHWGDPYSTVFVGGLSPKVTQRTLHELMSFAGPVVAIRAPHLQQSSLQENNTGNWQRKLYAFVEFANRSGVRYACRVMNGIRLYDILITVRPSKLPKPESSDTELFVGNLASNCDEGILEEIFSICGKIVEINVSSAHTQIIVALLYIANDSRNFAILRLPDIRTVRPRDIRLYLTKHWRKRRQPLPP